MNRYFSCLLVGDWGTGKTTAASTAPPPVLFLDVDNKIHKMVNLSEKLNSGKIIQWAVDEPLSMVSLTRLATTEAKPGGRVTFQRPKGYLKLAGMVEKLATDKCIVNDKKVETVVLDSYTSVNEHIKRLLLSVNGSVTMTQPLWGALLTNFEELNNTLMRLPANIIVVCHERLDKDELSGRIVYRPLVDGQMSHKIGKDFEEVYYMEKSTKGREVIYEMLTVGNSMKSCRTSRDLPIRIEPDFCKVYNIGGTK